MFEFLLDINHLPELYTLYSSVSLTIMNLIWLWNIEIEFLSSNRTFEEKAHFPISHQNINKESRQNYNITWIAKCIRRKLNSPDDEDGIDWICPNTI